MSQDIRGRAICCDGYFDDKPCAATTQGVVALRPGPAQRSETQGWFFVRKGDIWQHFCPRCAPVFLKRHLSATTPSRHAIDLAIETKGV